MKVIDCVQGSTEWLKARAGIPTASCFDRILTPAKLRLSGQSPAYMHQLLAEIVTGRPIEDESDYKSFWMRRGSDLERKAVEAYEFQTEQDSRLVGFLTNDEGTIGASPDRLVGEDGACEMKAPKLETHIGYMLDPQTLVDDYRLQLYGQLYVGRGVINWDDIVSFHPDLPLVRMRVYAAGDIFDRMDEALPEFVERLKEARHFLEGKYGPFGASDVAAPQDTRHFLTDEDVDAICAAKFPKEATG